jgi:hypothetical protein
MNRVNQIQPRASLRFLAAVTITSSFACASTSLTSLVDPSWTYTELHRVMVYFASDDLAVRESIENRFQMRNPIPHVHFIPAIDVLFPGRSYAEHEIRSILAERGIDAVVLVAQGQSGESTSTTPIRATTACTLWTSTQGCLQTQTTASGGRVISKPWASYAVYVVTSSDFRTIWMATAKSKGNAFASWATLSNSVVDETIYRLVEDGVFR